MQQRKSLAARRVLGLFVAVWLNMALQPCAMAFGSSDYDCMRCPPAADSGAVSARGTRHMDRSAPATAPCETSVSQCTIVDDFNYDSRAVKVKDAPGDVPVGIAPCNFGVLAESRSFAQSAVGHLSLPPGGSPPLNVLYCVFLI